VHTTPLAIRASVLPVDGREAISLRPTQDLSTRLHPIVMVTNSDVDQLPPPFLVVHFNSKFPYLVRLIAAYSATKVCWKTVDLRKGKFQMIILFYLSFVFSTPVLPHNGVIKNDFGGDKVNGIPIPAGPIFGGHVSLSVMD